MRAEVRVVNYTNGDVWWAIETDPVCFAVWWKPDGSKTIEEFLDQEAQKMREWVKRVGHRQTFPAWVKRPVPA